MTKPSNQIHALCFTILLISASCTKKSHLNQPVDQGLQVLATIEDAQALLDYTTVMKETPALGELSADDFYLTADSTINPVELNAYLWKPDIFMKQRLAGDWFLPYKQVYYVNSILTTLPKLNGKASQEALNRIKGACLFIRGYALYNVALEFAGLYSAGTETDPGIPLPLTPDPEAHYARASIQETYDQILNDIKEAVKLLPREVDPGRKNRPSVPSAFALLARIYLSMGNFTAAKTVADSCLDRYAHLMDYNKLNAGATHPFPANNEEVLYQSNLLSTTSLFFLNSFLVDSTLYHSYSNQDLRKELFFATGSSQLPVPRFNYSGNATKFSGLATDEVFLIRAECHARLGNKESAMLDLTKLLNTRWDNNVYPTPVINTAQEALDLVLTERRKELVFRGLRWIDIRRLNIINPAITLKRWWMNTLYTLPPGDRLYVLPIPPDVIEVNNRISPNER
jgi:starch-binding outer membrane protein, SusD/RagB family